MQSHIFTDYKSLLQLFSSSTETEFLNLESNYSYEQPFREHLVKVGLFLGDKKFIHERQVYDFMAFLGDAGGIQGSMMLIGATIHFFLSFDEQPA